MSSVSNLNQFRKQKARVEKRRQGDENAAKHGRSKAQKLAEEQAATRATQHLDQHKRDD